MGDAPGPSDNTQTDNTQTPPAASSPEPTTTSEAHRRATESMRDATKWLIALAPGATLALAVTGLLPRLAEAPPSPGRDTAVALLMFSAAATVLAVALAAWVLTAGPSSFGEALADVDRANPKDKKGEHGFQADLDKFGVLRLYGYRSSRDFFAALATSTTSTPLLHAAGTAIIDFSAYQEVRRRFTRFMKIGGIAAVLALGALCAATMVVSAAPPRLPTIETAVRAQLQFLPEGRTSLTKATRCRPAPVNQAWVVSGDLLNPTLVIDGCEGRRLQWNDAWGEVVPVDKP